MPPTTSQECLQIGITSIHPFTDPEKQAQNRLAHVHILISAPPGNIGPSGKTTRLTLGLTSGNSYSSELT